MNHAGRWDTLRRPSKSSSFEFGKRAPVLPLIGPTITTRADLTDLLAPALSEKPDDLALVSGTTAWSWRDLSGDIDRLATQLVAMGLLPGARVASLMPNRGELLLHFLACLKAGLVVTPLNYRYTAPEIDYALGKSGASMLFAHAERAADIKASSLAGDLPYGLISFGRPLDRSERFEDMIERDVPAVDLPEPEVDAPTFVFFTSGSTGKPKGVTHSLQSFGSVVASFAQAMVLTSADIVLPGGSLSHVGALSTALAALSAGAPVVVAHSADGDELLPLLRQHRPSILVMLPAALIALQHDHAATGEDFSSLRLCITGGDKFPPNLEKEFTALTGLSVHETYGMTENPDCLLNPPDGMIKPGSVGIVCPGYVASVRDEDGQEVSAETEGRLWMKGAPLTMGYWGDPAATKNAIQDGWLDTGDVMRVDSDGYFWFRGRKKQIIVHDGSNIAPQEIEDAVMAHPAVANAGVVGVRDEVHGENVWAYVTLKDDVEKPSSQDIIRRAREQVGYKAPEVIIVLDEMPLNATGKVDRKRLKEWAAERVAAGHLI